ncbi:DUF3995 domain-containing protein [Streptomyces sp. NPDC004111]|uniref:DUF3995 domain-containing protein n=1 Tax=Streptomyces sp. NPDC004111 TaxID=3364690 RepID=UPI00369B9C52
MTRWAGGLDVAQAGADEGRAEQTEGAASGALDDVRATARSEEFPRAQERARSEEFPRARERFRRTPPLQGVPLASPSPGGPMSTADHTARRAATLIASVLAMDAALHLFWATGSTWPAPDEKSLSDAVLGLEAPFTPVVVVPLALLLLAASGIVLIRARRRTRLLQLGLLAVLSGLSARGLAGLLWLVTKGLRLLLAEPGPLHTALPRPRRGGPARGEVPARCFGGSGRLAPCLTKPLSNESARPSAATPSRWRPCWTSSPRTWAGSAPPSPSTRGRTRRRRR